MTPFCSQPDLASELERSLSGAMAASSEELQHLLQLAGQIQTSTRYTAPTPAFRSGARSRLVAHMAQTTAPRPARDLRSRFRERLVWWVTRASLAFTGLCVAGVATASASASALPGDPLYSVKQAGEQIELQFAASDSARARELIDQADTRLDEAALLMQQGRASDAADVELRYADTVDRAVSLAEEEPGDSGGQAKNSVRSALESQSARLTDMLADAPVSAQPGLERARSAAEKGLSRAVRRGGSDAAAPPPDPRRDSDVPSVLAQPEDGREQSGAAAPGVAAQPETGRDPPDVSASDGADRADGHDQHQAASDASVSHHSSPPPNPPSRGQSRAQPARPPKR
jgi:hypothetical protein